MSGSQARRARRAQMRLRERTCGRGNHAWKTGSRPEDGWFCAYCGARKED